MNGVRNKYLETISKLIMDRKNLMIITSDYAGPALDQIRKINNSRYVSAGIAEQNMIEIACGLTLSGQRAVAYGLAPFPCIRAVDQIRNAVAMMHLPVSIVSIGVGSSPSGPTHYCVEDVSIMRSIPGIKIINLTDEAIAVKTAELALTTEDPLYVRIDKNSDGVLYKETDIDFDRGFSIVKDGSDIAVIASGYYTNRALKISERLMDQGINLKVIDLYALPFDQKSLMEATENCGKIVTIEEHVLAGGIGSAVLEAFNNGGIYKPIKRMAIDFNGKYPNEFGSREYFMKRYNLDDDSILNTIKELSGGL